MRGTDGDLLFEHYPRYRVVLRGGGCRVHATPGHEAPQVGAPLDADTEFEALPRLRDVDGLRWVCRRGGAEEDDTAEAWIAVLSCDGKRQLEQLPQRRPIRHIAAGGNKSIAFGGEERPVRRWLAQLD